jgi:hypothetical protein
LRRFLFEPVANGKALVMTDHHSEHPERENDPERRPDPEAPDPAGNPADHTAPRTPQHADPERVERGKEEFDRTIAT